MNEEMTASALEKELITTIRSFFLNNPLEDNKKLLWELYTSWVYQDETGDPKEHRDLLFFYECLIEFMDEVYEMIQSTDKK